MKAGVQKDERAYWDTVENTSSMLSYGADVLLLMELNVVKHLRRISLGMELLVMEHKMHRHHFRLLSRCLYKI